MFRKIIQTCATTVLFLGLVHCTGTRQVDPPDACESGHEACSCSSSNACLEGLSCVSGVCVELDTQDAAEDTTTNSSDTFQAPDTQVAQDTNASSTDTGHDTMAPDGEDDAPISYGIITGFALRDGQSTHEGIEVSIEGLDAIVTTDGQGRFLFEDVPSGAYTGVTAKSFGYQTESSPAIVVVGNQITDVEPITLSLGEPCDYRAGTGCSDPTLECIPHELLSITSHDICVSDLLTLSEYEDCTAAGLQEGWLCGATSLCVNFEGSPFQSGPGVLCHPMCLNSPPVNATATIGTGSNGTVTVTHDNPGASGNAWDIYIEHNVIGSNPAPLKVAVSGERLLILLATTPGGSVDASVGGPNSAANVAALINTKNANLTASASGNGTTPLVPSPSTETTHLSGGRDAKGYDPPSNNHPDCQRRQAMCSGIPGVDFGVCGNDVCLDSGEPCDTNSDCCGTCSNHTCQ